MFDKERINNFFKMINNKIENGHLVDALNIIVDTLKQPDVSFEFNHELNIYKEKILNFIKQQKYDSSIDESTKDELWSKIYHEHIFDLSAFEYFLKKFNETFDDDDLNELQMIFLDKKVNLSIKIYLYIVLVSHKVDYDFIYFNQKLNKKFNLNPINGSENLDNLAILNKKIESHYFKDPSKAKLATSQLNLINEIYFPDKIEFEQNLLIDSIINYIDHLFDNQIALKDNEIIKLLESLNNKNG